MTHILIPREPSTALLRPFIGCNTQELHEAWAAMIRIAEVQHARAGSQCLAQIEEPAQPVAPQGVLVGEIVIFGGDLKEVSWAGGKMPPPGTKLYAGAAPAAVAGPAREEIALLRAEHGITSTGRGIKEFEQVDAFVRAVLQRWGAAPALEAPAAPACDEEAAFTKWFQGEQGKPYQGMWEFARAAWMARAATAAAPQAPAAPRVVLVDWDMEDRDPVEMLDKIYAVYQRSMGKPAPDVEMAEVVELTKDMLLAWWGEHREDVRAAMVATQQEAAPAAPAVDAASDTALLDAMQRHRIALVPEFEGPWDAEIYNDDAEGRPIASGNTPREALRAALAAQAATKGEHGHG